MVLFERYESKRLHNPDDCARYPSDAQSTAIRYSISFAGATVHESTSVKNLGLVVDKHLSYHCHVNHVSKCTGALPALNHAKHVLPPITLKPIVIPRCRVSLRYCISIYGTCGTTELRRVQKVLNFCARVISDHRKYSHVTDVPRELKWLSAPNLAPYHRICNVRTIRQVSRLISHVH